MNLQEKMFSEVESWVTSGESKASFFHIRKDEACGTNSFSPNDFIYGWCIQVKYKMRTNLTFMKNNVVFIKQNN